MGLNRFKDFWQSGDDSDEVYTPSDLPTRQVKFEPETKARPERVEERRNGTASIASSGNFEEQLKNVLDQCMQVVSKDPDVALRAKSAEWEIWFQEPLLSSTRTSSLPLGLKLRLMAFLALMLPFLDEKEQERLRNTLSLISVGSPTSYGEVMTEQDLIHTLWLIRGIKRSRAILPQMEALKSSIMRHIPQHSMVY